MSGVMAESAIEIMLREWKSKVIAESAFEIMLREWKSQVMAESAFEIMLHECKGKVMLYLSAPSASRTMKAKASAKASRRLSCGFAIDVYAGTQYRVYGTTQ